MISRSHAIKQRAVAAGSRRVEVMIRPEAVKALETLQARFGLSITSAVNAAIILHEEATRD